MPGKAEENTGRGVQMWLTAPESRPLYWLEDHFVELITLLVSRVVIEDTVVYH